MDKGDESYQENRKLAVMPEFSLSSIADGSYVKQLEAYFTDRFAGRSYWISANGVMEANVGERIVNGVYIADDKMLDISAKTDGSLENTADFINEFVESYDGTAYFVAVPSSSGVYDDLLPEYISGDTEKQKIDKLYSLFDSNIRKIDAYNILKMLNDNYIYYRNDSKWTSYGAYCVYRTVIQKLGFLPSAYDKYTIEHISGEFRGDLYNKTLYTNIKADMLDIYEYHEGAEILECIGYNLDGTVYEKNFYEKSYINSNDMYKLYLGDEAPMVHIKTSVNNEKKLLIIKDSYANCFIPFLLQHYSEIDIISPESLESGMSNFINIDSYEQTLFLFGIKELYNSEFFENLNK